MQSERAIKCFFFFNDTATTEIYTLSLHDALPICSRRQSRARRAGRSTRPALPGSNTPRRSEEHTSELQSQSNLVCRLLLEKKKNIHTRNVVSAMTAKRDRRIQRPAMYVLLLSCRT